MIGAAVVTLSQRMPAESAAMRRPSRQPDTLRAWAARWAASSYNEQPWYYLVAAKADPLEFDRLLSCLLEANQAWAKAAPVLILGVAKTKFSHSDAPNRVALYDLGAAASYLTLQAAALGLATHQMGGFNAETARKSFEIPEDYLIGAVIALGYQGEPAALPNPQFVEHEVAPCQRKSLSEIVFSEWGTPASMA